MCWRISFYLNRQHCIRTQYRRYYLNKSFLISLISFEEDEVRQTILSEEFDSALTGLRDNKPLTIRSNNISEGTLMSLELKANDTLFGMTNDTHTEYHTTLNYQEPHEIPITNF